MRFLTARRFLPSGLLLVSAALLLLPEPASARRITDIRWGRHEGFSRCVIEFDGDPPRHSLENRIADLHVLYCDLWSPDLFKTFPAKEVDDPDIRSYQTLNLPAQKRLRLAVKVGRTAIPKVMTLRNPGRLVIDFHWGGTAAGAVSSPSVSGAAAMSGLEIQRLGEAAFATGSTSPASRTSVAPGAASPGSSPGGGAVRPLPAPPSSARGKPVIVIDPGHGGWHKGAIGQVGGITVYEKNVTLSIARKLKARLDQTGKYTVHLTRTSDVYVGLQERTTIAEKLNGDLFISLHCNAAEGRSAKQRARGLEFWVWNKSKSDSAASRYLQALENEEDHASIQNVEPETRRLLNTLMVDQLEAQALRSRTLCESLSQAFLRVDYFKSNYRGTKSGRFKVLETYQMPSILVEMGFLTHPSEAKSLVSDRFQNLIAECLARGIGDAVRKLEE